MAEVICPDCSASAAMSGDTVYQPCGCKRIEELEADNQRLREALRPLLNYPGLKEYVGSIIYDAARKALEGSDEN